MSETNQIQLPRYFSLRADGDSAIIRVLHSSVSTIEKMTTHRVVNSDGKNKKIKCLGEDCPLCKSNLRADERIYIHLFDYTDNTEKIWERTDKIMPKLIIVEQSWKPLNSAVLKITRKGNEFPQYNIEVLNPMQYQPVDASLIDTKLAKFYASGKNAEEMNTYLTTGSFPERKKFIPKDEYFKMKQTENQENGVIPQQPNQVYTPNTNQQVVQTQPTNRVDENKIEPFANNYNVQTNPYFGTSYAPQQQYNSSNPFMDNVITPKKV